MIFELVVGALIAIAVIVAGLYGLALLAVKMYYNIKAYADQDRRRMLQEKRDLQQALDDLQYAIEREERKPTL